ncbi:glycosyl hydrolase [Acidipila sp. EB88]|uniref:glycosyl hydrolase n=1 Tax=Acidipila sp. EB88 TaxID=2305226 RepID=UPI00131550AD|nr:glycosyl hydrolase [Acidipila sp. EB88]
MDRRDFLRIASLTSGSFALPALLASSVEQHAAGATPGEFSPDELPHLFHTPVARYRPMVRWWWNGDRITQQELLRELDVLKSAGIGGVEINPIRFPAQADPMHIEALTWMSEPWIKALDAVLAGAKDRGMVCDMIVGSGWPFGGEFLTREDQTQMMTIGTREFTGPQRVTIAAADLLADVHPQLVSAYSDPQKQLVRACVVPYELSSAEQAVDIPVRAEDSAVTFDVAEGRQVLYFLVKMTGYMAVINGAPGASGPVLNHYSGEAVARYLDRISDALTTKLGPLSPRLRAFFTDSIELEGANWCDDMLQEFARRRGYDLAPYLPFVLFKVGAMGNAVATPYGAQFSAALQQQIEQVRYDFETTKRELFNERFVATFVAWCHRLGVQSRMQAYGMECDPISAGMMVDIPECETWIHTEAIEAFGNGDYTTGRSYSMINKFVSSAAHLAGKRLISCEEMTNTDDPFHTTLERIKIASDQSILSGVTQPVLHGFNYSPPQVPFPGWVRYGTYFSEHNTWWPYFNLWTTYSARLSSVLQACEMQADIAILPPQADVASKFGFQRDPFPRIAYPDYLFKLWEVVHQNGSGCDYLSEEIIRKATVREGRLHFGSRAYKAVLLPKVQSLHPETVQQLCALVESGGTLIFLDTLPEQSDGLRDHESSSTVVHQLIASVRTRHPERTPLLPVRQTDMVGWYRELQQRYALTPDVRLSAPVDYISQVHYREGKRDVFFFCHYGPQDRHTFEASFGEVGGAASLWNPETGERTALARGIGGALTISLGPSESRLIVFEPVGEEMKPFRALGTHAHDLDVPVMTLTGPWKVRLQHVDGSDRTLDLATLIDFNQRPDLRAFAGTLTYSCPFATSGDLPQVLSLGRVHSVSKVRLNGHLLGVRWYGEHRYPLAGAAQPGRNEISIEITTTLGSYMKTLPDNPTAKAWTADTPDYPLGLTEVPVLLGGAAQA